MIQILIDLVVEEYSIKDPIEIAQLIEQEFQVEVNIIEIENYLIQDFEDYEKESRLQYYTTHH